MHVGGGGVFHDHTMHLLPLLSFDSVTFNYNNITIVTLKWIIRDRG